MLNRNRHRGRWITALEITRNVAQWDRFVNDRGGFGFCTLKGPTNKNRPAQSLPLVFPLVFHLSLSQMAVPDPLTGHAED
jgi:hypothetical protein